ncbi:MAG: response regulator [Nitrosopumilaceae archaeon]
MPDLVILDLMMPHYDGIYSLEGIREINADAKIMVMTADTSLATKAKLKGLKPTTIVYKSTDTETILGMYVV